MAATNFPEKSQRGLIARWWGALTGSAPESAPAVPKDAPLREAAGTTVDSDDGDWRRLSGDGMRDLAPMTQARMQRLAHYQWETNVLANRLIELPVAYLLAEGVRLTIKDDEDAQAALDRHWDDGINAWDIKLPKRVRELALFGEQCYPVFLDEIRGFVRLGYLDPALIETVVTDPDNREQPIVIVTKKNRKGIARRYRILVNVPETALGETARGIRETATDGDCFYMRVNELSSATRGRSDLLAQIDWLDAYDQYLFGELDGAVGRRAYIWDVTMNGATEAMVKARAKEISAPSPGSVRVHNDSEVWKAESPELQSNDAATGARLFRNHILGGATVPEQWFGGGGDVNRSTGETMLEPTEKILRMRQRQVGHLLVEIGRYVVRAHWNALDKDLTNEQAKKLGTVEAKWPELTSKDITKVTSALSTAVIAIQGLLDEGLLTRATALRLVVNIAARLGVEIDAEAELDKATEELAERGGSNLGGLNLRARPPAPPVPADDTADA